MRILLWHGYLLAGTGSNVYTQAIAREWARAGHDVTVFSQEPHPERFDLGGARVVRPDVGGLLPVFVVDRYGEELTTVITHTIERWDGQEAARRIELHVGRDLQFIRINGTIVGGLVGVLIHTVTVLV